MSGAPAAILTDTKSVSPSPPKTSRSDYNKNKEGVIIYSDHEDEESLLKIFEHAPPLQGTISMISQCNND